MSESPRAAELDERRKQAGLTQRALCELAGINISTFTRLLQREEGHTRTYKKLAAALDDFERKQKAAAE